MILKSVRGSVIVAVEVSNLNSLWRKIFNKDRDILVKEELHPKELIFFLVSGDQIVGIGRYRYVENILIDNNLCQGAVWGRGDVGIDPEFQGRGFGFQLVKEMNEYARKNGMVSCIGFHDPKLSDFYRKCGLEIDSDIGKKLYRPDKASGELASLAHVNVSYFQGDPFILEAKNSSQIVLPYSW